MFVFTSLRVCTRYVTAVVHVCVQGVLIGGGQAVSDLLASGGTNQIAKAMSNYISPKSMCEPMKINHLPPGDSGFAQNGG